MTMDPSLPEVGAGPPSVQVFVLGRFAVEVDGAPLRFPRRAPNKPLDLLKALVALGGESVSAETLAEAVWPDADGDQAQNSLHTTLSRLRDLVGTAAVTLQNGRMTLERSRCWVDAFACAEHLTRVQRLLDEARLDAAGEALREALTLYAGPVLDGEFQPAPVLSARERLHDRLLRAVDEMAAALHRAQRYDEAIALLRRALERDDQAESLYQGLMRACLAAGRTAEGLAVYQRCAQVLRHALDTAPSPETEQLRQALAQVGRSAEPGATPETGSAPSVPPPPGTRPRRSARPLAAAALVLAAALAAAGVLGYRWLQDGAATAPVPDALSIAVLAFENLSGDPTQEYFSDGIADSILTALVRIPKMRVVARNSSFAYKGRNVDVRQIGRELNVRHVLEGSVLRDGDRLRVTAQLIDASTGQHAWARTYDRQLRDVFDVLDDITRNVFTELGELLVYGETMRYFMAQTANVEAYDKSLRAAHEFGKFRKNANAAAIRLATDALELDPGFTTAMVLLGWAHMNDARMRWSPDPKASSRESETWARRCVETAPESPLCLGLLSRIYTQQGRHDDAIALGERAAAIEPENAVVLQQLSHTLLYAGQSRRAVEAADKALRLRPVASLAELAAAGEPRFLLGRYEESRPFFERMVAMTDGKGFHGRNALQRLIAIHMAANREGEAHALAARLLEVSPQFTLRRFEAGMAGFAFRDRDWYRPWLELLRQAGLPE